MRFVLVGAVMLCASLVTACAATPAADRRFDATPAADDAQPDGGFDAARCTGSTRPCSGCAPGFAYPCVQSCGADGAWGPCREDRSSYDRWSHDAGAIPNDSHANDGDMGLDASVDTGIACGHWCEPCCDGTTCVDGSTCLFSRCVLGAACDTGPRVDF